MTFNRYNHIDFDEDEFSSIDDMAQHVIDNCEKSQGSSDDVVIPINAIDEGVIDFSDTEQETEE